MYLDQLANLSRRYTLITDTIKAMEWWACFRKPEKRRKSKSNFSKLLKEMQKQGQPGRQPQTRTQQKVGRSDPGPCGSGKKYKKCCLNKQQG